jgi:hypothetical protein
MPRVGQSLIEYILFVTLVLAVLVTVVVKGGNFSRAITNTVAVPGQMINAVNAKVKF